MASVVFEGVTKTYGDVTAVDRLSLEIGDGELMVLLGPSGCGKTTALRMIAGFEEVTEGTISIGGRVVNGLEPSKRNVAMVFQSYALYPHMTVERNVESPLLARKYAVDGPGRPARKLTRAERAQRVAEALRVLELEQLRRRKPRELSGGQRQRVAVARAMVARPDAYLLDEPLSNLDAKLRAQTRRELVELHRMAETTAVHVTHDQVEAMTMATRLAVMNQAVLQQVGTPEEVYSTPANRFVAQFLGTPPMNCIAAAVTTEGRPAAVAGACRFPLPPGLRTRLEEGRPVLVGVRPEDLALAEGGGLEGGDLTMKVTVAEWLGHERLVYGELEGEQVVVKQHAGPAPSPGQAISLVADPGCVHLFDPGSGARIP